MTFKKGNKWAIKSNADARSRANKRHLCLDCRYSQEKIFKNCPDCGSKNRQYFMSDTEFKRGLDLLNKLATGKITKLKFQHKLDLEVNGRKICSYIADASYYEDGVFCLEDSKPLNHIEELSLVKIKLCEAIFGIVVKIPQRKSGDRTEGKKDPQLF